jgi:hypothetical protein
MTVALTLAGLTALAGTLFAARRVPPSRVRVAWGLWACAAACWLAGAVSAAALALAGSSGQIGWPVGVTDLLWWLSALLALAGLASRSPPGHFSFHLFTLDALPIVLLAIVVARIAAGQTIHSGIGSQLFSGVYLGLYSLLALVSLQLMALDGLRRVPPPNMWILGPGFCLAAAGALAWSIEGPGHQIVRIQSQGATLYCLGDLYHDAHEVAHPNQMADWTDQPAMLSSRLADAGVTVRAIYLTSTLGNLVELAIVSDNPERAKRVLG